MPPAAHARAQVVDEPAARRSRRRPARPGRARPYSTGAAHGPPARRRRLQQPLTQPAESTRSLLLKVDGLTAEVSRPQARVRRASATQLLAGADEREQLRYLLDQAERRANRAENDLKSTRARLRKAGNRQVRQPGSEGPTVRRPRAGLPLPRAHPVGHAHACPASSATARSPDYIIGPRFLDSLERLEGIKAGEGRRRRLRDRHRPSPADSRAARSTTSAPGPGGDDPVRIQGGRRQGAGPPCPAGSTTQCSTPCRDCTG